MKFLVLGIVVIDILSTFQVRGLSAPPPGTVVTKILCYGDSLTAGTVADSPKFYPYGKYLEEHLKFFDLSPTRNVAVKWRGFPGWTAAQLATEKDVDGVGLRDALLKINANEYPFGLVVILAGTNDLGLAFQMNQGVAGSAAAVSDSVIELHKIAHDEGVPTLAISIPESGFQHKVPDAKAIAIKANEAIEKWCMDNCDKSSYVEFPFGWSIDDSRWSSDGLHLSEEGYFELAKGIAPIVYMNGRSFVH